MRIILLCFLLMLAGCSTSRKLTTSTEQSTTNKTVADTRAENTSHTEQQTATVTQTGITETGDVEITRREYDTTQPIDTITGAPPLKNETVIRRRSEKEIRQEQATSSKAAGTDSSVITDNTRHDEKNTADTRTTEKQSRHPPWLLWVVVAAVLAGAYKFLRR